MCLREPMKLPLEERVLFRFWSSTFFFEEVLEHDETDYVVYRAMGGYFA